MSLLLLFAGAGDGVVIVLIAGNDATMLVPTDTPSFTLDAHGSSLLVPTDPPTFTIET